MNLNHSIITTVPGDINSAINRGTQHYAFVVISMIAKQLDPAGGVRDDISVIPSASRGIPWRNLQGNITGSLGLRSG
jgi:hypothetical protein